MSISTSNAELKAIAKERSLDRYGSLILANILIFIIQLIISGITSVSASGNIFIFVLNLFINLIVNILLGVLVSGKAYLYLNLVYSQTISASDIFFGLKQHPEKAVAIQAVFVLVDFIVSLPGSVLLFVVRQNPTSSNYIFLLLKYNQVYIKLFVDQSYYIYLD